MSKRPIIRYHGGKWKAAPWIIEHFPPHKIYTEVFGGGASVLLRKPRSYVEIYNDLNKEIVNMFEIARNQGPQLKKALELTPFSREEFKNSYDQTSDRLEQARRTIVRSFMGFGSTSVLGSSSGFRDNSRGDSVPAISWRNYVELFDCIVNRLQGVIIESRPAIAVLKKHDSPDSLHYVDPPYLFETRGKISPGSEKPKHRYEFEMSTEDHIELAGVLKNLNGAVILSGYESDLYDDLYAGWQKKTKQFYSDGNSKRVECLWLSPAAAKIDLFNPAKGD